MASELPAALVRAAERLIAERGSDVPIRDIIVAADAGNASAVNYHFGGRRGLIAAIFEKHEVGIDRHRHEMLDAYEAAGVDDFRALAAALVVPLAQELTNDDGGHGYLQLASDRLNRLGVTFPEDGVGGQASSVARWRRLAMPLLTPEAVRLHRRFDAIRFTVSELARRARSGRKDHRLFISQLTDAVTGFLSAPISEETRRLMSR